MKILIVEDESSLRELMSKELTKENHVVETASAFAEASEKIALYNYDCILLDIMLPDGNGLKLLEELKKQDRRENVIILSARNSIEDKVLGLDLGADDYLPKPFAMGELLARVRALLRRRENFTADVMACGNILLDRNSYELKRKNKSLVLSKTEFQMMELFMLNRGIYLSTEDILVKVWGYETDAEPGIVWVYISNLRKKLVSLEANVEIKAKRNIGYTLEETI